MLYIDYYIVVIKGIELDQTLENIDKPKFGILDVSNDYHNCDIYMFNEDALPSIRIQTHTWATELLQYTLWCVP